MVSKSAKKRLTVTEIKLGWDASGYLTKPPYKTAKASAKAIAWAKKVGPPPTSLLAATSIQVKPKPYKRGDPRTGFDRRTMAMYGLLTGLAEALLAEAVDAAGNDDELHAFFTDLGTTVSKKARDLWSLRIQRALLSGVDEAHAKRKR